MQPSLVVAKIKVPMTFYFTASPEALQLLMGGLLIAAICYVGIFYAAQACNASIDPAGKIIHR